MIRRTLACALAIAGATAFVAAPPARAATALCASHGKRGFKKLSLPADQRKALLRSLTTETIRHGRITTTHTRAKEVQKHFGFTAENVQAKALELLEFYKGREAPCLLERPDAP